MLLEFNLLKLQILSVSTPEKYGSSHYKALPVNTFKGSNRYLFYTRKKYIYMNSERKFGMAHILECRDVAMQ
jgi:hypothetical protein